MQLAPIATPSATRSAFANLQVVRAGLVEGGIQTVIHDSVNLGYYLPKNAVGSTRVTDRWVDGENRQSWYETNRQSYDERDAAAALEDALDGSGLIALLRPTTDDIGNPVPGHTRIYVDRRAQFLDFETGKAPAPAQAVVDALDAYRALIGAGSRPA